MPKCKAIIEKYTEFYPKFWARKIIWAYQKLKKERIDTPFYWSDIRSLAGVKKQNFKDTIPYLSKYADETTVNLIISLT